MKYLGAIKNLGGKKGIRDCSVYLVICLKKNREKQKPVRTV